MQHHHCCHRPLRWHLRRTPARSMTPSATPAALAAAAAAIAVAFRHRTRHRREVLSPISVAFTIRPARRSHEPLSPQRPPQRPLTKMAATEPVWAHCRRLKCRLWIRRMPWQTPPLKSSKTSSSVRAPYFSWCTNFRQHRPSYVACPTRTGQR